MRWFDRIERGALTAYGKEVPKIDEREAPDAEKKAEKTDENDKRAD